MVIAVREPELEHVLGGRALLGSAAMAVHVDEAGEEVHLRAVDLFGGVVRPALRIDGHFREADAAHFLDAVPFDDHVHRPDRRRAGAVDDGDAADDQPLERTFALIRAAVGRVRLPLFGFLGEGGEEEGGASAATALRMSAHCSGGDQRGWTWQVPPRPEHLRPEPRRTSRSSGAWCPSSASWYFANSPDFM